jgi:hypothetical protein
MASVMCPLIAFVTTPELTCRVRSVQVLRSPCGVNLFVIPRCPRMSLNGLSRTEFGCIPPTFDGKDPPRRKPPVLRCNEPRAMFAKDRRVLVRKRHLMHPLPRRRTWPLHPGVRLRTVPSSPEVHLSAHLIDVLPLEGAHLGHVSLASGAGITDASGVGPSSSLDEHAVAPRALPRLRREWPSSSHALRSSPQPIQATACRCQIRSRFGSKGAREVGRAHGTSPGLPTTLSGRLTRDGRGGAAGTDHWLRASSGGSRSCGDGGSPSNMSSGCWRRGIRRTPSSKGIHGSSAKTSRPA